MKHTTSLDTSFREIDQLTDLRLLTCPYPSFFHLNFMNICFSPLEFDHAICYNLNNSSEVLSTLILSEGDFFNSLEEPLRVGDRVNDSGESSCPPSNEKDEGS